MLLAAINEEKVLLERVAAGDRQAFGQLYSTYLSSLYRYIFLFTKSKEETEERHVLRYRIGGQRLAPLRNEPATARHRR